MKVKLSIIIPIYNRSFYLKSILFHFTRQDHNMSLNDYEIIVIDDGSEEKLKEIVDSFDNLKIRYFKIKNSERGFARNYGANKAEGEYLNFFDSDDIPYSNHITTFFQVTKNYKNISIFHLSYDFEIKKNKTKSFVKKGDLNKYIFNKNILSCNSIFINKKLFNNFKFHENRKLSGSEDWHLWLRIINENQILGFDNITSKIIYHNQRSMLNTNYEKINQRIRYFINLFDNDENLKLIQKNNKRKVLSELYMYLSLHSSILKQNKFTTLNLLIKSLFIRLNKIFEKKFLVIIFNIIFR
tara:strand:+ start:206 stop:1099 length:894 start_codon:yes stop_codon:yes gene_type:complete